MNKGFSLVELIVVIAIMAILVGVAVPVFTGYIDESKKANDIQLVDEITHALQIAYGTGALELTVNEAGLDVPLGYIVLGQNPVDGTKYIKTIPQDDANDTLDAVLRSVLGDEYASIGLSYGGWNAAAGDVFFSKAGDMVSEISQTGATTLDWLHGCKTVVGTGLEYKNGAITAKVLGATIVGPKQVISKDYKDSGELMLAMADYLAQNPSAQAALLSNWESPTGTEMGYGFTQREFFSGTRLAYNTCLANYIDANDPDDHSSAHISNIKDYGDSAMSLLGINNSKLDSAFKNAPTFPRTFYGTFKDGSTCETCSNLRSEYHTSGQAKSDANNYLNTLLAGASQGREIYENGYNGKNGTAALLAWMGDSANEVAEFNNKMAAYVSEDNSVIVISVYIRDGHIQFGYSPVLD